MIEIPPQPVIPPESDYNEVELSWIEEQPPLFPTNQDSNYGVHRRTICFTLQELSDQLITMFNNRFAMTAEEFLADLEFQYGLVTNPPFALQKRRALILDRARRNLFTRQKRQDIVESFIIAVEGIPLSLTPSGLSLTAGGLSLFAGNVLAVENYYRIVETVEQFKYEVGIDKHIGADILGLTRELNRITPAGIQVIITEDYIDTFGVISVGSVGVTKAMTGIPAKTFGASSAGSLGLAKVL